MNSVILVLASVGIFTGATVFSGTALATAKMTARFAQGTSVVLPSPLPLSVPQFSPSVPKDVVAETMADFTFIQGIQGTDGTPIYRKIFGAAVDGSNLNTFFSDRITGFDMDDCGGGSGVAACVQPMFDSHIMWLTQNYVTFKIPQIYRISVILHESRHTEDSENNWPHASCPVPYQDDTGADIRGIISGTLLEGKPACDTTEYGAYGLEAAFLKNIEMFCSNCSAKVQMDGKLFGEDTVKRIIGKTASAALRKDLGIQ